MIKVQKQTNWVIINHAKVQDENNGNITTHYSTAKTYINQLKKWVSKREEGSSKSINNPLLN